MLSQIINLVKEAQSSKAPIQRFADIISAYFVPIVLVIAALSFLIWLTIGANIISFPEALPLGISALVGVLVIACPCALVATGTAARKGILVKNATSLEKAHSVDTVIFDKTGTLTAGDLQVTDIKIQTNKFSENEIFQAVASLEQLSSHPLGMAIVKNAKQKGYSINQASNVKEIAGQGITGIINSDSWIIGTIKLLENNQITTNVDLIDATYKFQQQGKTVIHIAVQNKHIACIALADVIKPGAISGVKTLQKNGIEIVMLTGDNKITAQAIANKAGITNFKAEIKPEEKSNIVKEFQTNNNIVAMVGDGINDAPALAQADIGIAMSTGTDVAIESSDITILHGDIKKVAQSLNLSKRTIKIIKQNLFWAFFYNAIGIPLAAGLFYPFFGWMLSPIFAGAAMAFSSVSVLTNSLRLRK